MVVALGAAQAVARELLALQAEHRQVVQIRAFAKHLARLRPGGVKNHKQRPLAVLRGAGGHGRHDALGGHKLARKHQIRLPLRIGQQRQQRRVHLGARPAKGPGVGDHIGNQPARVAGLERLDVGHDQAHARPHRHRRTQRTQAMAERQAATGAALATRPAPGAKGFGAARDTGRAKAGDGVGQGSGQGRGGGAEHRGDCSSQGDANIALPSKVGVFQWPVFGRNIFPFGFVERKYPFF